MTSFGIVASLWAASLRGALEYRTNFVLELLLGVVRQGVGLVLMWVILARFEAIAGWRLGEVVLLYGLRLTMLALCGLATGSIWGMQDIVRLGEFDRFLVRPVRPLLQLLTLHVPILAFADLFGGVVLIVVATGLLDMVWTPQALGYLLFSLIGGALIQLAMRLLFVSFSFRALNVTAPMSIVDDLFNEFGTYPLSIFNVTVQALLTFGLPVAFMAYFPTVVLLRRTDELPVPALFAYGAPLAGVFWMAIALWVFEHEMRAYQSAGH